MSQISLLLFSLAEKELFGCAYLIKRHHEEQNINISSLKQDFKNLIHTFWAHTNRGTMQQKLYQSFLSQEGGASGNDIEKES